METFASKNRCRLVLANPDDPSPSAFSFDTDDGTKADALDAAANNMLLWHLIRAAMFPDDNSSTQNLAFPGFSIR